MGVGRGISDVVEISSRCHTARYDVIGGSECVRSLGVSQSC